ncbi:(-)-germacrene D synthase-like isoform X2 [Prosopis cineraria]|uniref:(-)-germacrene D synthase-like isoform X2 n=1 Tax=Prosopis cineraria TaxID=364024 RepID=UPI00240EEC44|nr:(-)-germacrene D synthase-like isoform X2 [Prosopis cineraria]
MSSSSPISQKRRSIANFSPNSWDYHLFAITPAPVLNGELDIEQRLQHLKNQVRKLILTQVEDLTEKLNFIDNIKRLGVSYHFENEIGEIMENMSENHPPFEGKDLHTTSLWFRLLRQEGYHVPSDVFDQFKDENGDFKKSMIEDVVGMLSLYEAAHFAIHGEDFLDKALHYSTYNLKSRLSNLSPTLERKVIHALNYPIRRGMPRFESRYYIPMYSSEASPNDPLLELAIIDFNVVQALHKKELNQIIEWWKKLDFLTNVPYARDRVVEGYFWVLGVYFEPQFMLGRTIMTKLGTLMAVVDDTYDAYGTIEELELFTQAIGRWDASSLKPLPQCMKVVLQAVFDLFNVMELLTIEAGKSCFVPYVKRAFQQFCEANLVESKWHHHGYIPTYEEYIENGIVTCGCPLLLTTCLLGLENSVNRDAFDWISQVPKMVRASSIIFRVVNDMGSHKFEKTRLHIASTVKCLMNQHGILELEAYKLLQEELEDAWKDINEEYLKAKFIPKVVLQCVVNFTNIVELLYENFSDKYTHGELLKDHIRALVIDPIGN